MTLTTPPKGVYEIELFWILTGTAETAAINVKFKVGTVNLISGLPSTPNTTGYKQTVRKVTLDGATSISLNAVNASVVGSIYSGYIVATQIG